MSKIFLSHSSQNKDFIRPIAKYFGNDRCVFDEVSFEAGMPTLIEIFKNIDLSSLFVYFISDAALNSTWVQQEINRAQLILNNNSQQLSQIFPIIIDENITHEDPRIPDFLRKGSGEYNLRHIDNYKIACKKIETQLVSLAMRENDLFAQRIDCFVGRAIEKKKLRDYFEERTIDGKIKHIKCLVVSGIQGVGKKAYIRSALKEMGLMENNYFPMTISLEREESIDDVIVKISDLGFGGYRLSDVTAITSMNDKIDILIDLLQQAQKYLEHIIVEDNGCILDESGSLKYWFERTIEKIDNQITISIISHISIDTFKRKSEFIFGISLEELSNADSIAMLRKLSKLEGVPFGENHIDMVASVLSGYPPQVEYCVELAKEKGINYAVNNQHEIYNMPNESASKIVELVIESEAKRESYLALLSLLAKFGSTPMRTVEKIVNINTDYKKIIARLKRFSICTNTGSSKENLKLNPVIRDFVQRMKYEMTPEIKEFLRKEIQQFQKNINNEEYTDYLDFSELTLYLKEKIKEGKPSAIPDKFLYSTLYVQAILDLYNEQDYDGVISLICSLKNRGDFLYLDDEIKKTIQFYYCNSLARKKSEDFNSEVIFFQEVNDYQRYNFLKGFQARLNGHYVSAEKYFTNVLNKNFNHHTARRELVLVYSNLQEYDTAFELAKMNYNKFPENIYHIQAFFDCIIRKSHVDDNDLKLIAEMMGAVKTIHKSKKTEIYFQIEAKYQAFILHKQVNAIAYIDAGLKEFPNSFYLARDGFDIQKHFKDISGMEYYYSALCSMIKRIQNDFKIPLFFRECYLQAYKKKPLAILKFQINSNNDIPQTSKEKLINELEKSYN
jgi:hypothetical protein